MRIIIPACGRGERFKAAGYDTIKPLVPVFGRPMIERVIEELNMQDSIDEVFVVANWDGELKVSHDSIRLNRSTLGAGETVLLALKRIPDLEDSSILLLDSDAIYHCDVISKFREFEKKPEIRAGMLCFKERDGDKEQIPKYSYAQIDANGTVVKIAEKMRVGPLANTGAYWFASAQEFRKCAEEVIRSGHFQNGEAYVSCVLDRYILLEKTIRAVVIDEVEYSNIGTPEALEIYLRTLGPAFLFDLDGTLVDTTPAYVKAWHKLLAPKGAFVDEKFFLNHISGLSDTQVMEKFKMPISSAEKDEEFVKHVASVQAIPGAKEFVRKCQKEGLVQIVTNSNKIAALSLLKHLDLDDVPIITAQDVCNGKPNAEPYVKAARDLGVSPENCVVFEDSRGGLISGRAALCKYVIGVANISLVGCDAFLSDFVDVEPVELLQNLASVCHLSDELSEELGQAAKVYPVRASGGYISEILSASCGSRKLVLKQENKDHGVLQDVSEHLSLHNTECVFYESFAHVAPLRTPMCYGVLKNSRAIVMEDLRQYSRAPAFTIESGLKVVNAIATFHSHFRGSPLGKLSVHKTYMKQHVLQNYTNFKAKWKGTLSAEVFALFDHAFEYSEDAEAHLLAHPRTLLHGDLKFPNLFWDFSVNGGEPIFIDWQYAGPGNGIEDVVFLLVESCDPSKYGELVGTLTNAYYDRIQILDGIEVPPVERRTRISCALAGFPFFVAVWFGCIDATKLSEPNFPFLYILRLANAFSASYDADWFRHVS